MSTLYFLESFDWCSTNQLARGPFNMASTGGRVASRTNWGWGEQVIGTFATMQGSGYSSWTCGMACDTIAFGDLMTFKDDTSFGQPQVKLSSIGDGRLVVNSVVGGTTVASHLSPVLLHNTGGFYYFEFHATEQTIKVPSGPGAPYWFIQYSVEVHVNGNSTSPAIIDVVNSATISGLPPSGAGLFQQLILQPTGAGGSIDDVYLTDNEFLGNISVQTLFPWENGSTNMWSPNVAMAPNYSMVNEHNPGQDDNTTYVYSAAANDVDFYKYGPLVPFVPPDMTTGIKGVQLMNCFATDDTGTALVSGAWKNGGGPPILTGAVAPSENAFVCQIDPRRYSINTNADWAQDEVNDQEAGAKRLL